MCVWQCPAQLFGANNPLEAQMTVLDVRLQSLVFTSEHLDGDIPGYVGCDEI